jgi:hypothetical protein
MSEPKIEAVGTYETLAITYKTHVLTIQNTTKDIVVVVVVVVVAVVVVVY